VAAREGTELNYFHLDMSAGVFHIIHNESLDKLVQTLVA